MKDICRGCIYLNEYAALEYRPLYAGSSMVQTVKVLCRFCKKHMNYVTRIKSECPDYQNQTLVKYCQK